MYAAERQNQILQLVNSERSVSVNDLSARFDVSKATIRTDLTTLEEAGLLTRTHGGAIARGEAPSPAPDRQAFEDSLLERAHQQEKERIAAAAVALVDDGDFLLLDTGTTALAFARQLATAPLGDLTVYTNDLHVLGVLEENPAISANVLPGKIRSGFHYSYGDATIEALRDAHFSRLILTTSALDVADGLTVVKPHLASLKRAMINASKEVILLTDSSKVGETRFRKFADLAEVDVMITDDGIAPEDATAISALVGHLEVC